MSFRHYVPRATRLTNFPFTFEVTEIDRQEKVDNTITFDTTKKEELINEINVGLQAIFDFSTYMNPRKETYIGEPINHVGPTYTMKIDVVQPVFESGKKKPVKRMTNSLYIMCHSFKTTYKYVMVESLGHLQEILDGAKLLTYDAETSGLDPEFDTVAGINFATDKDLNTGYYIPLNHKKPYHHQNLPVEAFEIYYNAMTQADKVYMYNARFDIRNAEFQHYENDSISHNIKNVKFDMSKVTFIDTQVTTYFADPAWKENSLKWAEKHFLGFHRLDLTDIMKLYNRKDYDTTKISPSNLLFYAGQDAISTLRLGLETEKYLTEFGLSGQIDMEIIYPLMQMENRLVRIDTEYVEQELAKLDKRLDEIEALIKTEIGENINLNSSQQKAALFESFGLDTGVKTAAGAMSTSREAVEGMIKRYEAAGQSYPQFLKYLGEQSQLQQLRSTFFYSLQQQMYHRDGRVRLNYRHGNTATGRFSSGKEQ